MGEGPHGIWVPPGGSADPRREQPPPQQPEPPPPDEIAEQLKRLRATDVVLSLLPTLAQLAYAKLDDELRDLAEARVAIDAIGALLPLVEPAVSADVVRDFRQLATNLQLAYASAADEQGRASSADRTSHEPERTGGVGSPGGQDTSETSGQQEGPSGGKAARS